MHTIREGGINIMSLIQADNDSQMLNVDQRPRSAERDRELQL